MTVKDEGPCGRAGKVPRKPRAHAALLSPSSELLAQPGAPTLRSEKERSAGRGGGRSVRSANCKPESVTLGDGGIKAC